MILRLLRLLVRQLAGEFPQFPEPSGRRQRAFGVALEVGFRSSIALTVLLVLGLAAIQSSAGWFAWTKAAAGIVLFGEGALLASNRWQARQLVLWRISRKSLDRPVQSHRARLAWWAAPSALSLLGLSWLAAGLATAALALETLF